MRAARARRAPTMTPLYRQSGLAFFYSERNSESHADGAISPDYFDATCATCNRPLPANSRPNRRFCSTSCRVRAWHLANPPVDDPEPVYWGTHIRGHMHRMGPGSLVLIGHRDSVQWHGKACPPECPGLRPGE